MIALFLHVKVWTCLFHAGQRMNSVESREETDWGFLGHLLSQLVVLRLVADILDQPLDALSWGAVPVWPGVWAQRLVPVSNGEGHAEAIRPPYTALHNAPQYQPLTVQSQQCIQGVEERREGALTAAPSRDTQWTRWLSVPPVSVFKSCIPRPHSLERHCSLTAQSGAA